MTLEIKRILFQFISFNRPEPISKLKLNLSFFQWCMIRPCACTLWCELKANMKALHSPKQRNACHGAGRMKNAFADTFRQVFNFCDLFFNLTAYKYVPGCVHYRLMQLECAQTVYLIFITFFGDRHGVNYLFCWLSHQKVSCVNTIIPIEIGKHGNSNRYIKEGCWFFSLSEINGEGHSNEMKMPIESPRREISMASRWRAPPFPSFRPLPRRSEA